MAQNNRYRNGEMVILTGLPAGFVDDLPDSDRLAVLAVVGKRVKFIGYDEVKGLS